MPESQAGPSAPLVLIANDEEWAGRSLESILSPNGYAVVRAYTGAQTLERARAAHPALVVLDAQLSDMPGVEVCRALRDDPAFGASTPIIITTSGPSGRAQRLEAYRAGAWEFLGQPIDGEALLLKLRTFIQSKQEADGLRDESLVDHSTGLYSMRGLARRAREIGSDAWRRHDPLTCVVLSSAPGAAPGADEPELAGRLAEALRRVGRASDAIGRLSTGEFGVVAPRMGAGGVERMVGRLREALTTAEPPVPLDLRAGYSGVPDYAEGGADAVELLLRATTALRDLRKAGAPGETIRPFTSPPPS